MLDHQSDTNEICVTSYLIEYGIIKAKAKNKTYRLLKLRTLELRAAAADQTRLNELKNPLQQTTINDQYSILLLIEFIRCKLSTKLLITNESSIPSKSSSPKTHENLRFIPLRQRPNIINFNQLNALQILSNH